jgi:hypothetical protein
MASTQLTQVQKPHIIRRRQLFIQMISILAMSTAHAQTPNDTALPKRKPGLWKISTISSEFGMQTNTSCISADDSIIGPTPKHCPKPQIKSTQTDLIVTFDCPAINGREVTSMIFSGDYSSKYRSQSKITYFGNNSEMHMTGFTIEAQFIADNCD